MEDHSWYREPLGDYVEAFDSRENTSQNDLQGYARALSNWERFANLTTASNGTEGLQSGMSPSQETSFRLLHEWWGAEIQDEFLSAAARHALLEAAAPNDAQEQYLNLDRGKARLTESRYHKEMFMLFQLEFVKETRLLQTQELRTFIGFVQAQRERCAQYAALQRIAHSFVEKTLRNPEGHSHLNAEPNSILLGKRLQNRVIPACIESCPWLNSQSSRHARPFYLWDVRNKRTIECETFEKFPPYTCVSHTWGRWPKDEPLSIPGVPWPVPQNFKFSVAALPEELFTIFEEGFIWIDLFCIPQDRSERALIEISRQAAIFGNARSVIAWLHDALCWDGLRTVTKWLSFVYLNTSANVSGGKYNILDLNPADEAFLDDAIELYIWDPVDFSQQTVPSSEEGNLAEPVPWFSSLWTLQEACLRPDMILCNRNWDPLCAEKDVFIPLDSVIALSNYVDRGTYKKGLPAEDHAADQGQLGLSSTYQKMLKASSDLVVKEPERIPGSDDLGTLLVDTCMNELNWISPAAVLTFGQLRQCKGSRVEAIMSVIGATKWYQDYISQHGIGPPETGLVLGLYPTDFLNEALANIGPTFFTAIPTDLRFLECAIELSNHSWHVREDRMPIGSMMPFTSSPAYLVPPQKYSFNDYNHPAVATWKILENGSVHVKQAGILTTQQLAAQNDMEIEDMIIAPVPPDDDNDTISSDTEIETVDQKLQLWLESFSNAENAPNFAVCLYQQIYLSQDIPGPQVGLLLKQVGRRGDQLLLVKIGQYYTKYVFARDIETFEVDWLVL